MTPSQFLIPSHPVNASPTHSRKRTIFTNVSPLILAPTLFIALVLAHWTHKCLLMIIFQNKIIYMPSLPPGSRREKLTDYSRVCGPGVEWVERKIKSLDGTKLSLAVGKVVSDERTSALTSSHVEGLIKERKRTRRRRILVYFQGNGSSIPPRTPMLSNVLRSLAAGDTDEDEWILVALSYRGYWTSSGRPHQSGIEKDAQAVLHWVIQEYSPFPADKDNKALDLVLWGQSIGAGVASHAASTYMQTTQLSKLIGVANQPHPRISRLILETPFLSLKTMLGALYPQKWLPYRHLHPFLLSNWDTEAALKNISLCGGSHPSPKILMVVAARDEIVPVGQADRLQRVCEDEGLEVARVDVLGALHTQASTLEVGKDAIVRFLKTTGRV